MYHREGSSHNTNPHNNVTVHVDEYDKYAKRIPSQASIRSFQGILTLVGFTLGLFVMYQYCKLSTTEWKDSAEMYSQQNQELRQKLKDLLKEQQQQQQQQQQQVQSEEEEKGGGGDDVDDDSNDYTPLPPDVLQIKTELHQAIQEVSQIALMETFGPGPHQVLIQLDFDPHSTRGKEEEEDPSPNQIIVEMANAKDMPHTVYMFLQQVHHKLWDGCSFHRNAGHVLQAGPTRNFKTPPQGAHLLEKFRSSNLESVKFQEYSPRYPHEKYTLGLAGRPGGADFYVSTQNNTLLHGPGGQTSYDDPTEADPCFAKVVSGKDVIDRMTKLQVADRNYRRLTHNVAIRYMKIL